MAVFSQSVFPMQGCLRCVGYSAAEPNVLVIWRESEAPAWDCILTADSPAKDGTNSLLYFLWCYWQITMYTKLYVTHAQCGKGKEKQLLSQKISFSVAWLTGLDWRKGNWSKQAVSLMGSSHWHVSSFIQQRWMRCFLHIYHWTSWYTNRLKVGWMECLTASVSKKKRLFSITHVFVDMASDFIIRFTDWLTIAEAFTLLFPFGSPLIAKFHVRQNIS
jgi:hypothetical protein